MIKRQVKDTGAKPCRDPTEGLGCGRWVGIKWTRDFTVKCVWDALGFSIRAAGFVADLLRVHTSETWVLTVGGGSRTWPQQLFVV